MNLFEIILPSDVIVTDLLWFLVFAGWIILIVFGLEADKPLSGGIPNHIDLNETHIKHHWSLGDRIGELGAWAVFAAVCALLPAIVWWIFAVHGG